MTVIFGATVLIAALILLIRRPSVSMLFASGYLVAWHSKDLLLDSLGVESGSLKALIGVLVDLGSIIIILSISHRSKYVFPLIFGSLTFGVLCLLEHYLGFYMLGAMYGWVMAIVGAAVLMGGYFGDPGGNRIFNIRSSITGLSKRLYAYGNMAQKR